MKIENINESNIFYTNIVFGKMIIDKVVIAPDEKALKDTICDNFEEFSFFHSVSLQKLNEFLIKIKNNRDKKFVIVYEFINYEDEFQVKEEILFIDDIEAFKEKNIKEEKNLIIWDEEFVVKAYSKLSLMRTGEVTPLVSSSIEI
jgi:hypothetical protein